MSTTFPLKLSAGELSRESTPDGMTVRYSQRVDFVGSNNEVIFSFELQAVNNWGMQQHDYCEDISCTDVYACLDEKSKEKYPEHKDMLQSIVNSCVEIYDDSTVSEDSDEFTGHIKFKYYLSCYAIEQLAIILSNVEGAQQHLDCGRYDAIESAAGCY